MKTLATLVCLLSLSACAEALPPKIAQPLGQIRLGTATACTVVDPASLPKEAQEPFMKGCIAAAKGFEILDQLFPTTAPDAGVTH